MLDPLLSKIKLKSLEEIIAAARECVHKYRRKFLQRNLRPYPENCQYASMMGYKVVGCTGCGSQNANKCLKEEKFTPLFTKKELAQQFADELRDPQILLRKYRDLVFAFWCLGAFDKQQLNEEVVAGMEKHETKKAGK